MLWSIPLAALFSSPSLASDFDDAYPSVYVDDLANEALMLPKILSCILSQAGVGSDNRLTNASWAALVNEQTCDLGESDLASFAKTVLTSSRASDSTPQEVTGWMDTSIGEKMVMSAVITQAPTLEDPFGRFTISFYRANPDGGDSVIDPSELDVENDKAMYGYAYVYADATDIIIDATYTDTVEGDSQITAKAVINDGNPENVRYAIKMDQDWMSQPIKALGTTSADKSFRYLLDDDNTAIGAECTSRSTSWQNTWQMGVYDSETGAKVDLEFPSLAFNTEEGNYGDVNSEWFWIDPAERFSLTPTNNELNFTPMKQSGNKTLVWTPSDLQTIATISYVPMDGDTVNYWTWNSETSTGSEVVAVFETDGFYYGENQAVPSFRTVWSHQYDMNVYISEDDNGDQSYVGKRNVKVAPSEDNELFYENSVERAATNAAKLHCVGWSCPDKNLGLSADEINELLEANNGNLPWDVFHTTDRNADSLYTYFLAPLALEENSELTAGALYFDANDSGSLDTGDEPVMFNFRMEWSDNAIYEWDGTKHEELTATLASTNSPWLGFYFDLVSDDCNLNVVGSDANQLFEMCDKIKYHHNPSNGYAYVRNADGSYYLFSDPITMKLENFDPENHDRNNNFVAEALANGGLPEIGTVLDGNWNPLTGKNCDVETWETEYTTLTNQTLEIDLVYEDPDTEREYCMVPVSPDYFAGKTFYLNYDGRSLQGINGVNNVISDRFYQMINLKSGTVLVDVNDQNKSYKVKPVYVDEYLQNLTQNFDPAEGGAIAAAKLACSGEGIVFELDENTADGSEMLSLLAGLPPAWFDDEYIKPSIAWSERPTLSPEGSCFVKDQDVTCP